MDVETNERYMKSPCRMHMVTTQQTWYRGCTWVSSMRDPGAAQPEATLRSHHPASGAPTSVFELQPRRPGATEQGSHRLALASSRPLSPALGLWLGFLELALTIDGGQQREGARRNQGTSLLPCLLGPRAMEKRASR